MQESERAPIAGGRVGRASLTESFVLSAKPHIVVIGAGLAGAACAAALAEAGERVTLLEKARGPGGRMSTRWTEHGAKFDHGAQFFRASSAAFDAELKRWQDDGWAARWTPSSSEAVPATDDAYPICVGTPTMNAPVAGLVGRAVAAGAVLQRGAHVQRIAAATNRGWTLTVGTSATGDADPIAADRVVVTAPAPQTHALVADAAPEVAEAAAAAAFAPCWALMLEFERALCPGFEVARVPDSPIAWMALESSKLGRAPGERWVLHASPQWSAAALEWSPKAVEAALLASLADIVGEELPAVLYSSAHRWRFSLVTRSIGAPVVTSACGTLFAAGDWCLGGRVEAAWQSGIAAANAVRASF